MSSRWYWPGPPSAGVGTESPWFILHISLWLWFTIIFANFAEALAEGRGKAQADALRSTRTSLKAHKLADPAKRQKYTAVAATDLRKGDVVVVNAGEYIPGDGEVIEGVASVDESAVTGESAPVIRESGGDRSAVTGGTKVLSDWLVVRVTANPGESFLDRIIGLIEAAKRKKTPNEIALEILLAGLTLIFLLTVVTLLPFSIFSVAAAGRGTAISLTVLVALLVCLIPTTIGGLLSAIGIAGMDRMIRKNVIAMSGRAVEAAGDVDVLLLDKTGTITLGNRQATAFIPADDVTVEELADAAQLASLADETPEGRSIVVLAKEKFGIRERDVHALGARVRALLGPDPDERRRLRRAPDPQGRRRRHRSLRPGGRRDGFRPGWNPPSPRSRRAAAHRWSWRMAGARAGRDSPQGRGQGRHQGAVRRAPRDGHQDGDDHRRQPAHRRRHRGRGRAWMITWPRPPRSRSWR